MNRSNSEYVFFKDKYDKMLENLTDRVKRILCRFDNFSFPDTYYYHEYQTIELNGEDILSYGYDLKHQNYSEVKFYITYRMDKHGMHLYPKYFFNFPLETVIDNMYLFIMSEMKQVLLSKNYKLTIDELKRLNAISNISTKGITNMEDYIIHEIFILPNEMHVPSLPRYIPKTNYGFLYEPL
jgi:hypothetical protein